MGRVDRQKAHLIIISMRNKLTGCHCLNRLFAPNLYRAFMTEICPAHFRRHRFPAEIIARSVWLYIRFPLNVGDVEGLFAERGINVSFPIDPNGWRNLA